MSTKNAENGTIVPLLMNGEDLENCHISELVRAVALVTPDFDDAQVVVHHLLGHVTADEPDAMINAMQREKIDLVLHWAI